MTLYEQMLNTAELCGMHVISKEHAAQLMAVVYLYGDESTVFSEKMNADIRFTQERFGLKDGRTPDMKFIRKVSGYTTDIVNNGHPDWLNSLEERYSVTFTPYKAPEPLKPSERRP